MSPLATVPTLASIVRIICSRIFFRFTVVCLAFAFLFASALFAFLTLSDVRLVLMCHEACAAQGRERFSVPVPISRT